MKHSCPAAAAAESLQSCPTLQPHRRQPARLPHPWDSTGKNAGVGCHLLLQCVKVKSLSRVRLLATLWTAAHQAPPSLGFSRQEHWSGLPFPSLAHESEQKSLSHVQLLATPWTAAHQAPPSMGFSRQESWSGVPWPSPTVAIQSCVNYWVQQTGSVIHPYSFPLRSVQGYLIQTPVLYDGTQQLTPSVHKSSPLLTSPHTPSSPRLLPPGTHQSVLRDIFEKKKVKEISEAKSL